MFKYSYTSSAVRFLLNENLQEDILNYQDKFWNKIEFSLLYNAYPQIDCEKIEEIDCEKIEDLSEAFKEILIKERISQLDVNITTSNNLNLDEITSKQLLVTLYEYYLRQEMIEYVDFGSIDNVKKRKKVNNEEEFNTFLTHKYNNNFIKEFDSTINDIIHDRKKLYDVYAKRPTYFLLYRIRNNILKEIKKSNCSKKHIENIIKETNKKYRELYLKQYNEKHFNQIKEFEKMKEEIFQYIEEEIKESIRNGRVVNIGNELANRFREDIQNDDAIQNLKNKYTKLICIDKNYRDVIDLFQEFQKEYIEQSRRYIDQETKINLRWLKEDFDTFLPYCISEYVTVSIDAEKNWINQTIINEIENELIHFIKNEYLEEVEYEVFVPVKNIELENKDKIEFDDITFIKRKELAENIDEYLGHKSSEFETDFFEKAHECDVFIKVEGIKIYKRDTEFIEELMLEKVNTLINLIYFYTARERSKMYKILDRILIIEKNSDFRLIKFSHKEGIFDSQIIENEWIKKIFKESKNEKTRKLLNSIKEYNKINEEKSCEWIIKSINKLMDKNDLYVNARIMTILIAGTNIFKYPAKGIELRFWLLEDFIEFLDYKIPYDNFIIERFLNFYKRVINIILSYNDIDNDNLIEELQRWILKIFPNDYIYNGEKKNE